MSEHEKHIVLIGPSHMSGLAVLLMHHALLKKHKETTAVGIATVLSEPAHLDLAMHSLERDLMMEHLLLVKPLELLVIRPDDIIEWPIPTMHPELPDFPLPNIVFELKENLSVPLIFSEDDTFAKEQNKLRNKHYKGKMNSPKK